MTSSIVHNYSLTNELEYIVYTLIQTPKNTESFNGLQSQSQPQPHLRNTGQTADT